MGSLQSSRCLPAFQLLALFVFGAVFFFRGMPTLTGSGALFTAAKFVPDRSRLDAHELLSETLTVLQNLLNDVASQDESSSGPLSIRESRLATVSKRDLASAFSGIFTDIGNSLASDASGASIYLGVGIANGTLQALNLSPTLLKQNTVVQPASGINLVAASLGMGLSSELVGSLNLAALLPSDSSGGVNGAVLALSQGLGSGAAAGLDLKPLDKAAFDTTGLNGIAGNLGQGLTTSFLSGVDRQALLGMLGVGNMTGEQVNQAALSLAQGLGSGAASALKLSRNAVDSSTFNAAGIDGVAGNLGLGLSTSLLQNVSLPGTFSAGGIDNATILSAAEGLGAGLGEGVAVGLGLQRDTIITMNGSAPDIKGITRSFARGLTENFLANGTLTKAAALLGNGSSTSLGSFNAGKIAQGLAIGLVDGASQSIENAGGVNAVFNLKASNTSNVISLPTSSTFDDGIGGAAMGLGNGLGSEAVKAVLQALGKPSLVDNSSSPIIAKRGSLIATVNKHDTAQSPLSTLTLASTIDPILQSVTSALGCQGIGGLVAIALSIGQKQGLSIAQLTNLAPSLGSFSNQTYAFKDSGGNTFTINIAQLLLAVNGNSIQKTIIITALHVLFASLAYLTAVPAILIINSTHKLAIMTRRTTYLANAPRWQLLLGTCVVLPSAIITFILGILGEGKRTHFYSAHGIMGLLLILLTLISAVLSYFRTAQKINLKLAHIITISLLLLLTALVMITGFVDISSISSCLLQFVPQVAFVVAGFLFAVPLIGACVAVLLTIVLERWIPVAGGVLGKESPSLEKGSILKPIGGILNAF